MRIGQIIADFRHLNRIEQKALADRIGISASVLSRIERGEAVQGESVVKLMTWAFGDEAPAGPDLLQIEGPKL